MAGLLIASLRSQRRCRSTVLKRQPHIIFRQRCHCGLRLRDVVEFGDLAPLISPADGLSEEEFLTPVAPPSVAASEPSYEPGGSRGLIRRYWRGPTWVSSAWLVWLGLRRLGYVEEAARLAGGVIGAIEREGLREYYDPRTGAGLGARDFAWSALVTELHEPDPDAVNSHL